MKSAGRRRTSRRSRPSSGGKARMPVWMKQRSENQSCVNHQARHQPSLPDVVVEIRQIFDGAPVLGKLRNSDCGRRAGHWRFWLCNHQAGRCVERSANIRGLHRTRSSAHQRLPQMECLVPCGRGIRVKTFSGSPSGNGAVYGGRATAASGRDGWNYTRSTSK